jgi:hypothetical protein
MHFTSPYDITKPRLLVLKTPVSNQIEYTDDTIEAAESQRLMSIILSSFHLQD